jgi:hypothetical protein
MSYERKLRFVVTKKLVKLKPEFLYLTKFRNEIKLLTEGVYLVQNRDNYLQQCESQTRFQHKLT